MSRPASTKALDLRRNQLDRRPVGDPDVVNEGSCERVKYVDARVRGAAAPAVVAVGLGTGCSINATRVSWYAGTRAINVKQSKANVTSREVPCHSDRMSCKRRSLTTAASSAFTGWVSGSGRTFVNASSMCSAFRCSIGDALVRAVDTSLSAMSI
ncbi:hypothetical protein H310_03899 [Aphanomyces invadans]|uniref:Uncharacterized protein n=1 Tax=Aphanomyces invadans TaxID=157072 RepID=A0A024UFU0_9STRA|nr:hypothetical protein H310_03899 [Aphanomyces invadans]ETW04752.1 hypothetical protein H310_03899 [Aphanomyces invadans]|eukprot:XP_008866190.1 hypothetical protein H310_03899 [Aphanomyces invadans]